MQLHYSWMVLVAIAWTIFVDDSHAQSSKHHSREPQLKNFIFPQKTKQNVKTINDVTWIRSKGGETLSLEPTVLRTSMEVVVDNDVNEAPESVLRLMTSNQISHKDIKITNALQKTPDNDLHTENDSNVPQCDPNLSLIALKRTTTVQRAKSKHSNRSKKSTLMVSKVTNMVNVAVDDHTLLATQSPTVEIKNSYRASKLWKVSPSSNPLIQLSRLNFLTNGIDPSPSDVSILSTAEYPGSKAELVNTYSHTTDNSIRSSFSSRKVSLSSRNTSNSKHGRVPSKDTKSNLFSEMEIQHQFDSKKNDERNIAGLLQDQTSKWSRNNETVRNTKQRTQDSGTNNNAMNERQSIQKNIDIPTLTSQKTGHGLVDSGNVGFLAESINSQGDKTNRGTAISYTESYSKISLQRNPTDSHSGPVFGGSSKALLEKPPEVPFETSGTSRRHVDTSFSTVFTSRDSERSLTRNSQHSLPHTSVYRDDSRGPLKLQDKIPGSYKKLPNLQHTNKRTDEKKKYDSKSPAMLENEADDDVTRTIKSSDNLRGRISEVLNSIEKLGPSEVQSDMIGDLNVRKVVDTTSTSDGLKGDVYRDVVKGSIAGLQIKNDERTQLISRVTDPELTKEQRKQQFREETKEDKNQERKLLTLPLENYRFSRLKKRAPAFENLSVFSLQAERQNEKKILNSISSVIFQDRRKIKLPVRKLEFSPAPRKVQKDRQELINPSVSNLDASGIRPPAANQSPKGKVVDVTDKNVEDIIRATDRPIGVDVFQKRGSPDSSNSDHDYEKQDCNNTDDADSSFPVKRCNRKRLRVSELSTDRFKASDDLGTMMNPDDERKRNRWHNRITDLRMMPSKPLDGISLKSQSAAIMNVTRVNLLHRVSLNVETNDSTSVKLLKPVNYIPKVRIDVSTINRLKLRDSTVVNSEAFELRRKVRDHITGETVIAVESCKTCEDPPIVLNTTIGEPGRYIDGVGSGSDGDHHHNEKSDDTEKKEQSLRAFQSFKDTTHVGLTKLKRKIVALEFGSGHASDVVASLAKPSARFKLIDLSKPEARVDGTLHQKNSGILVQGQESLFIEPETDDSIVSDKRAAHQPQSSGEINVRHAVIPSMLSRLDENLGSLFSKRNVGKHQSPFAMNNQSYGELKHDPLISGFTDNFVTSRIEFSNDTDGITKDYGNYDTYGTPRMGSGRARKSVGHYQTTGSSTSSTKTDSTTLPIDRSPYRDINATRIAYQPHSHFGLSSTNRQDGIPLYKAIRKEEINTGSTSVESPSITVTTPASRSFYEYVEAAAVVVPEVRDVKSTVTIIRTTERVVTDLNAAVIFPSINETGQSSKSLDTRSQTIAPIQVVKLSNVKPIIPNADNHDPEIMKSLERGKSLIINGHVSANIQPNRNVQPPANSTIGIATDNTFGYNANDNSTRINALLNQWPVKYSAVVEGDLVVGGLMMVHEREDSITCGPVMPQGGVQALEAMLYTLDWVNKRDMVPGVKIGAHILDDCDKDTYGLEMAVDFIKGSISNIDGAEYHCNKTAVRKVISGVVGAASSVTSIQVANLLRLFRIPQVSFFSTSPELSNKMRFEYFTRTIPSDHYQVKAMVDIVLLMGWSYVSIIYEESNYGEKAYEELEQLLGKHQICIAVKEKLSKDSGVAKAHVYDNVVLKLLTKPRARGCIIFASDQEVAGVMKAVRRCNATGAFSWIGSDGWSARSLVSDGNEPEMEGTLSVQPQANPVDGFEDYFLNLTVENNRRNPWFVEFWENHFKCRYPNASQTPYNNYTDECTTTERLTKQNTAFEDQLQFVSDAVMAFAYAFRNMHADLCHGNRGLCDAMKPTKGTELLSYLKKVQFEGLSGDVFHFDKNGDGPARYNIIHFKQVSRGKYKWIRVGKYLQGELRLNMTEIQFRLGHPEPPESVCSLPCEVGQAKKYVEGESCCWHCFNCTQYQIRHESDEKQCVLCPQGTVPDETHSYCRDIPENFLRPESGWAIGAMSFSSTGILITLFVGGVFLKHNDTPIVRASGRELSYVLLTGILLCYLVTFALVLRPNDIVCSIQRFSAGFCFTVVYAALLTKTNRISRIFNAGKHSAKRPSFISPRSQLIICSMLVFVQILINGVWMIIDPAKAMHHYPTREDNLLVCNSYIDASYMIAFTYPIILIVVCTVYAVLTRKIPEAFNESKHIGFTMYTTCVIWLAFVPLYFATGSQVALRITSMSVTISLSASVTIVCLFTPKLYIILIHPERNVRPNMMMTRYNTTKGSVITATNASSMMAPVTLTAVTCDQNKAVNKHVITTIDCSTQSEQFEMEVKDQKNGKIPPPGVTRSTQTLLNNNGKEYDAPASLVINDISLEDNLTSAKSLNNAQISNGPLSKNEIAS